MVLPTEEAALAAMFDMAVADHVDDNEEPREQVFARFMDDPYEVMGEFTSPMDTYSHESHSVEFSLLDVARQAIRGKLADLRVTYWRWRVSRAA